MVRLLFQDSVRFGGRWRALAMAAALLPGLGTVRLHGEVVAWGMNDRGQTNVPAGLSGVVAIAGGAYQSMALKRDGRVTTWGYPDQSYVPASLTNAVAIASGGLVDLAVRSDTTVTKWGGDGSAYNLPVGLSNVVALGVGYGASVALRSDGSVVTWESAPGPTGLSNVVAVAGGTYHGLALKVDGTVVTWGNRFAVPVFPQGLSEVVAVAAGDGHDLALKRDGTVVAWGYNDYGQTNVPGGLSNVVAIAAGHYHSLALRRDGRVVAWGGNSYGQINVPAGLSNVQAIAAGALAYHSLAYVGEGAPFITAQPASVSAYSGLVAQLQACAAGLGPLQFQWRRNGVDIPGQTNRVLYLENAQPSDSGSYALFVTNALGNVGTAKASLTVIDSAPVIQTGLTNVNAYTGKKVALVCEVVGSGPMSYRWTLNGAQLPELTGPALYFDQIEPGDEGTYVMTASNKFGVASSTAMLRVSSVTEWPGEIYPPFGVTNVGAMAIVSGNAPTVHACLCRDGSLAAWDFQGNPVAFPAGFTNLQNICSGMYHFLGLRADGTVVAHCPSGDSRGATNVPSGLSNVVAIAAGWYCSYAVRADGTVVGWGALGAGGELVPAGLSNVVSVAAGNNFALALRADRTVVGWGDNSFGQCTIPAGLSNVTAVAACTSTDYGGDCFSLALNRDGVLTGWGACPGGLVFPRTNVAAMGIGGWEVAYAISREGKISVWGNNSGILGIRADLAEVVALAMSTMASRGMALAGHVAPFLTRPLLNRTVGSGQNAVFFGAANGSHPMSYQWQYNGTNLPGATDPWLTIGNAQNVNAGGYCLVVSNSYGSVTSSVATLTVVSAPPSITAQPQGQTVEQGSAVTLGVEAMGSEPKYYQWLFNGTGLLGATNASLTLTNVGGSRSGTYSVVVSNNLGTALSSNASLAVLIAPGAALNTTGFVWRTSGAAGWIGQPMVTHDGSYGAQSGKIGHGQHSGLETYAVGPGSVSFWWKVSSEQYWDVFTFSINGAEMARISGEVDWRQETYSLPSGGLTLRWEYAKDETGSVGLDAAWLDEVTILAGSPPVLMPVGFTGNSFGVSFDTQAGKDYVLESKDTLGDGTWTVRASLTGDGTRRTMSDPNAVSAQRFYRVRQTD